MVQAPEAACRLAELAGGLSLGGDLTDGFPEGKAIRTAALAVELGRLVGAADRDLRAAYVTTLARFLGCTGFATEESRDYGAGQDIAVRHAMALADVDQPLRTLAVVAKNVGRGARLDQRVRAVGRLFGDGHAVRDHARAQCDSSLSIARAFGLSEDVLAGIPALMERWDGRGAPRGLRAEQLPLAVRLLHVADALETSWHRAGWEAALSELRRRRGGQLAPDLVDAALGAAPELAQKLGAGRDWEWFLESEPEPFTVVDALRLERVAETAGRLADLKSAFTLGHSERVARLGSGVLAALGASEADVRTLRLAGHLHDLGRVGVPNAIWDKPAPLSRLEREQAELHSLLTDRILRRAPALARLATLAAGAHERVDGSGYHRRLPSSALERAARVLAVADVAVALGEARPHRPAASGAALVKLLREDCPGLDRSLVEATLELSAGKPRDRRRSSGHFPKGLTDAEVRVLRVIAIGKSNAETAAVLGISPRTVQNHLASAYDKLGVSSRGGAALAMMEHGLLEPAE